MYPKLIDAGGFFLPTYGVLVALAFAAAIGVTLRLARAQALDRETVLNLAIACALSGMAGAKLFMFLFDWRYFAGHPGEILSWSTLQAAGVYQGGLILALAVAWWYMRKHGLPPLRTADTFAPGLALGHAIGRLGCFAAGCCYGVACDRPWAVTFTNQDAHDMMDVPMGVPLHPTQLYETGIELVIFAVLYRWVQRPHRDGAVIAAYLVLNSLSRFVIEFFRHHEQALPFGGPLSLTQWISLALLGAGLALLVGRRQAAVA